MAAVPQLGRAAGVEPQIAPEAAATQQLYERYSRQIYGFCLHRLGSREEAEDATQTTFLNAFRGLRRGISPEAESAWLFKIAHNVCLTRRRSSWRRGRVETPGDMQAVQDFVAAPQRMDTDELIELQEALAGMPSNQRKAILLREWRGMSYREIADEMELSQAAVETLIFRARRSLAKGLEEPEQRGVWKRLRQGMDVGSALAVLKTLFAGGAAVKAVAAATAVTSVGLVTAVPGDERVVRHATAERPAAAAAESPASPAPADLGRRTAGSAAASSGRLELPSAGATTARKVVPFAAPKAKGRTRALGEPAETPLPVADQPAPPVVEQPPPAPPQVQHVAAPPQRSEPPRSEEPKREARRDEPPKADRPKSEGPKAEAPRSEATKAEAPKSEPPKSDSNRGESPKAEAPKSDGPKNEGPRSEVRKAEAPKDTRGESPRADAPADGTRAAPPSAPQAAEARKDDNKSGPSRDQTPREEAPRSELVRMTSGPSADKQDEKGERKAEVESKVEAKAESKDEAKSETKTESKDEAKSEAKTESKPDDKVESKGESKSESKGESKGKKP